jgi:hypothetical protein
MNTLTTIRFYLLRWRLKIDRQYLPINGKDVNNFITKQGRTHCCYREFEIYTKWLRKAARTSVKQMLATGIISGIENRDINWSGCFTHFSRHWLNASVPVFAFGSSCLFKTYMVERQEIKKESPQ